MLFDATTPCCYAALLALCLFVFRRCLRYFCHAAAAMPPLPPLIMLLPLDAMPLPLRLCRHFAAAALLRHAFRRFFAISLLFADAAAADAFASISLTAFRFAATLSLPRYAASLILMPPSLRFRAVRHAFARRRR